MTPKLVTPELINQIEAHEVIQTEFKKKFDLYIIFMNTKQVMKANSLLGTLYFYAEILGLNLGKILGRTDLEEYVKLVNVQANVTVSDGFKTVLETVTKPSETVTETEQTDTKPSETVTENAKNVSENGFKYNLQDFARIEKEVRAVHDFVNKVCPNCGKTIHGRPNKVFCDNTCKAQFNRKKSNDTKTTIEDSAA